MEILISIGSKIAEYLVAPVGQWLCYSFHYDNNIKNMTDQVNNLEAKRDGMQNRVKAAENNVENIAADVVLWLKKVDDIIGKAKEFLEADKEKKNSSQGACLNLKLRHKHSKTAKKMLLEIGKLLNVEFDRVAQRPAAQDLVTPTYTDYMTFNSRMSIMKDIMEALGDADINLIGVWGMPGVGKSTLVNEVAKKVKEEKLFDEVAISIVKQNSSLEQIQKEISETLDLTLDKETLGERAKLLNTRLTKDNNKKRLVILDDVWEKLDLEKIGIAPKGCKVVVTSRNKDMLTSQMGTQKDFGLHILPKEEAWSLFKKLSGNSLKDSNLQSKAMEVSAACEGLPLALVTVATTLKNKRFPEWEDALQQLKSPNSEGVMYSAIELSYNYLESQELQPFFLLCAQIGSEIYYQDLLKKCFGLRLFHGINTLEKSRNRIYTLLRRLKDSGLLLDAPDISKYARMHDRVRDAALSIASKKRFVLTMRDEGPVDWPNEDDIKICTSICVTKMDINEFPENLNCPELITLLVDPKDRDLSFKIPDTFFKGMRKLKVIDLTYMRLSSLPSSLMLLTNLKTLCLDQCVLGDIAMIGEMKNLEILSLIHSEFKELPREIGFLTHLRMLDLSECKKLQVIPANVLSCLIQLEELFVGNSFTQWEVEGLNNERASLAELKHLSQLTTLEVHIPNANLLPKDLLFKKLIRYKIVIGDVWDWYDKHENSRILKLKLHTSFQLERGIKMLLNGIEDLFLDELKGVQNIIYELDTKGFQQLKHLHVQNNVEIKYIIDSGGLVISDVVFPALEIFSLKNMLNLEEICNGKIPLASFCSLRIVKVEHCEKLKFIFSSSIAKSLSQLQTLEIRECSIMGAIVIKEECEIEDRDTILFPQLRHLVLHYLPKFMSFLSTQKSVINDAGEIIPESKLDFQMSILQEQVVFPNLEKLELSSMHSEEILLHNQHRASSSFKLTNMQTDSRFQNLCILKVTGSANLKYLLSSSTARFMVQLKFLYIEECKVMEEIILIEDLGQEQTSPMDFFPQLEYLFLKDLPILKRFCVRSNVRFQYLKRLKIEQCPKLESFILKPVSPSMTLSKELKEMNSEEISHTAMQPLFNVEVAFPSLETLLLDQCVLEDIAMIGGLRNLENLRLLLPNVEQLPRETGLLTRLRILNLSNCTKLKVIPPNVLSCLIQLEELYVGNSFTQWEVEGLNNERASLAELKHLSRLTTLEVHIPDANMLPKDLLFEKLQRYKIFIGDVWDWSDCPEHSRALKLKLNSSFHLERGIKMLLNGIENLCLDELKGVKSVIYELDMTGFQQLKHLHVQNNAEIKYIINSTGMVISDVVFPVLEILSLKNMINLEEICHGQIPLASFRNLSIMKVEHCEKLKFIFSSSIAKGLPHLQKLVIQECSIMGAIIIKEEGEIEDRDMILFPQLRHLELHQLPKLVSFLNTQKSVINDAGEIIPECELGFHMPILQEQVVFPNLERLELSSVQLEEILLHNQDWPTSFFKSTNIQTESRFQNLRNLVVKGSSSLKYLLSSSTTTVMVQLKDLIIEDCKVMEEILLLTEDLGEEEIIPKVLFPRLEGLVLKDLPVLKRFCVGRNIIFRSLKHMLIEECPKLETFIFKPVSSEEISHTAMQPLFNDEVAFPNLETLGIEHMKNLKIIWNKDPQGTFSFQNLQTILAVGCESLKSLFPTSVARCLQQLNDLRIVECGIEEIIEQEEGAKEHARFVFPKLTKLILRQLPKLKWFYRGVHTSDWPLLKTLEVSGSNEIQIFASENYRIEESNEQSQLETSIQQPLFLVEEVAFPNLVSLNLSHMPNLEIIWHDKFAPGSFTKLQTMEVGECESLKSLFPTSVARCLQQLNDLEIYECGIEEIIEQEEGSKEDARFGFPKLTLLRLRKLSKLKWFYRGVHTSEWPLLKALEVSGSNEIQIFASKNYRIQEQDEQIQLETSIQQPLFLVEEVAFPNLETLLISYMPNLKIIWHHKFAHGSFTKLQVMTVQFCGNLMKIFQVNMLSRFQSLETLLVYDCGSVQEIFELHGQEVTETQAITVTQLKKLLMRCLPKLKHVWNKDPEGTFSFPNLEQVSAWECESLKSLFPTSVARCLKQLEDLRIVECGIEEIIEQEEGAKEDARFVFPKLTFLLLQQLPKLKWFYRGVHTSEWPLLKTLEVSGSNKIQIFASKEFRIEEPDEQSQLETSIQQPLFLVEEVAFPSLETLTIMHMENLKIIWHDQLAEDSFFKLQSLFVKYCENLVNIFESNMLTRFQSLETLHVYNCGSLQEVFEIQGHDYRDTHAMTVIPLKKLYLRHLPKMKQIWNKDPHGIFNFPNLQVVSAWECESLKSLFPASVARCLMQLEDLRIAECGVGEIVSREEIAEAAARFVFPKVTQLCLRNLPKLKWFCRGVHTSEWPLLKKLELLECDQIEIFASKILNFQETVEQNQLETSTQQPLFLVEEGTLFPNLEVLILGGNLKMKEMQCDQLLEECFYKLKDLSIVGSLAVSDWINFLKRLHSLEELSVELTSWEEIFPYEQLFDQENNATILAQLRELVLCELPTLTHLWKEDTQPSPILYNLENLIVSLCDKLKILVPSSISFQNLTNLEIRKCHGLINLVTSSTAKSLVQLKKMSVSECERITEVVVGEGGEASEVITFTQLIYLKLDSLRNLASFCSESYSFNFPSLEEVIVRQCPKMKTFSYGALGTPKLKKVQSTQEDECHWKVDLNTTIHCLTQ